MDRVRWLVGKGYTVTEFWEHDIEELKDQNESFREFYTERERWWSSYDDPIKPSSALYGGKGR